MSGRTIEWVIERLEICQDQAFQSCECEECQQCGKMPDECSGTECAKTCQCSTCDHCSNELALAELRTLIAAPVVERQDDALSKGFYTTRSGGGEYAINIGFRTLAEMQTADKQMLDLLRSRTSPPAPVAVVLPTQNDFEQFIIERDGAVWVSVVGEHRDYNEPINRDYSMWLASLDKVKEINQ